MINSIIFALLTMLIILVDTFLYFENSNVILQNINEKFQSEINLTKLEETHYNGRQTFLSFNETDNKNFEGLKYYPFINYTGGFFPTYPDLHYISLGYKLPSEFATNPNKFYPNGFSGTAIVDKEYLSNKFNNGKEIEVLAGDIDDKAHKTGVILTDYLVDGYNDYYETNLEYKDFIGQFFAEASCDNYINIKCSTICIYENNKTKTLSNTILVKNITKLVPQQNAFIYDPEIGESPKQVDFVIYPYNKKPYKWTIML